MNIMEEYIYNQTKDAEVTDEESEEYEEIHKELDAIERELSLFMLAGALGTLWYLWDDE